MYNCRGLYKIFCKGEDKMRINSKRILCCVIASLLFAAFLGGCGQEEEKLVLTEEETEAEQEETAETSREEPTEENVKICVDLGGAVANPGVYFLEEGSRLYQAVEMAGGFTGEAAVSALNQAQVLTDGQQIRVPTQEEIELQPELAAGQEESGIGPEPDGRVNINTADAQELMTLSGIGEARAQAIIAYREEQGGFASPEQIMEVSGIGEGIYSRIEDQIAVE